MSSTILDQEIAAALQRARTRSDSLAESTEELGRVLVLGGPRPGEPSMQRAIDAVRVHREQAEADRGLLAELLAVAPRLESEIRALRAEHVVLEELAVQAGGERDPDELRECATALVDAVRAHRKRFLSAIMEAYGTDIGGTD